MKRALLRAGLVAGALIMLTACGTVTSTLDSLGLGNAPSATAPATTSTPATTVVTSASESSAVSTAASAPAVQASTSEKVVFDLRAGYDAAFLVPASKYAAQPACGSGAPPAPFCADPAIVNALIKVDVDALAALNTLEDLVRNHPTWSAGSALDAAKKAIAAAETILTNHNIH